MANETSSEFRRDQITKEIRRDQSIGGIVAVVLVLFEFGARELLEKNNLGQWWWLLLVAALLLSFFAVFWIIGYVARRWHEKDELRFKIFMEEQIPLKGVGVIDGLWTDAIWDANKKLIQCSFIQIQSSRRTGFEIHGESYHCRYEDDGKPRVCGDAGYFRGTAAPSENEDIYVIYRGAEQFTLDKGVSNYTFRKKVGSDETDPDAERYFEGEFTARGLGKTRYVFGRKVKPSDVGKNTITLLEEFLSEDIIRKKHQPL